MSVKKDTEYLSVSSRIRFLETRLLNRERLERMIDASEDAQALKVLSECGYGELTGSDPAALEAALRAAQEATFRELASILPDVRILDVFRVKYDYHNAKVLLKAKLTGQAAERLLLSGGRYAPAALAAGWVGEDLSGCSEAFRLALEQAGRVLEDTGDAQLADMALDRAYFAELAGLARQCGSAFLAGYIRLAADAANLRACVRCARLDKDDAFLADALTDEGSVPKSELLRAAHRDVGAPFRSGPLAAAAELASSLSRRDAGPLTAFERECDDALMAYLERCRRCPFGADVVIGYLFARETEMTDIRTVMAGRRAGLDGEVIRQCLRACYV